MIDIFRHTQLHHHDPGRGVYGDCWRTVIACLLCLPIEEVPHVLSRGPKGDPAGRMQAWLAKRGLVILGTCFSGECTLPDLLKIVGGGDQTMHWMLTGTSKAGSDHIVICRGDKIIHDTSITQTGIVGPANDGLWWVSWLVRRLPIDQQGAGREHVCH